MENKIHAPYQAGERSLKVGPETGVKIDLAFCLGLFIEKTNSINYKLVTGYSAKNTHILRSRLYPTKALGGTSDIRFCSKRLEWKMRRNAVMKLEIWHSR